VCGWTNDPPTSCKSTGTEKFDGQGRLIPDASGLLIGYAVQWRCTN